MKIRSAKTSDARAVNALISQYAEQDIMLFRSLADIYENLQTFFVAEIDGAVVGCCALEVVWSDLAEIKSLAVSPERMKQGVGCELVREAQARAVQLGIPKVFALTMAPEFFGKLGYDAVEMETLPMKVWSDCARCPKQDHCDETAVVKIVKNNWFIHLLYWGQTPGT